jgi:hypothetical protein
MSAWAPQVIANIAITTAAKNDLFMVAIILWNQRSETERRKCEIYALTLTILMIMTMVHEMNL